MMPSATTRAAMMTWTEFAERASRDPLLVLPVGAFEQHGLHLPLNTDTVIADAVAGRLAEELNGIILPAIEYGARSLPRSGGGDTFPATTNLDGSTLTGLVADVVREQARHGVRRIVIVLGHGENESFVLEGVALARRETRSHILRVMVAGWWHFLRADDLQPFFPEGFPGWDREHAARVETALMLSIAPQLVRPMPDSGVDSVEIPAYTVAPHDPKGVPSQGSLSDPRGATAEMGDTLMSLIIDRFSRDVRATMDHSHSS